MVINDLHIVSISIFPLKAYTPLLINAYTALPNTVAGQYFEAVTWQSNQVVDGLGIIKDFKPSFDLGLARFKFPNSLSLVECFRILAAKRFNHTEIVLR